MSIRQSLAEEAGQVSELHLKTFGSPEGESIAKLVSELLAWQGNQPTLSLVAEEGDQLVGNVIFTPCTVTGTAPLTFIMAPLAVSPSVQGRGIGTALINEGLALLKEQGVKIVLVLGDPDYYSRTGFKAGHKLEAPYPLEYPEAWMAQELSEGALARAEGIVQCVEPLMAPEHW